MIEILKQMQLEGIFDLIPNDNLSDMIKYANDFEDIDYDSIERYLRTLLHRLSYEHNVKIGKCISDFSDKFSYEMFEMPYTCCNCSNGIYQKNITYRKAGVFSFGIDMCSAIFNLEERKLLKLIDHYYISLIGKDEFNDPYIYIPLSELRRIFPKVNNVKLKEKIINTCSLLNNKTVYWDFSKTRYIKKLQQEDLTTGKQERIVSISILYFPKKNKNGINGETVEVKGIICRINNFMKLRYNLNQISNRFPVESLECNYLSYIIACKLDYHLNLIIGNNKKKKNKSNLSCDFILHNLTNNIYIYRNQKLHRETYFYQIMNESNSKDSILHLLEAIMIALGNLLDSIQFSAFFEIQREKLDLIDYIMHFKESKNRCDKDQLVDRLYNDIISKCRRSHGKAILRSLIKSGNISLTLKL